AGTALAQMSGGDTTAAKPAKPVVDRGSQVKPKLAKEFVRISHFDFAAVQQMLTETPQLLNASWDLGDGDFEAGIEAASRVGDREIALYFMSQGARPNLFTATMLGHIDIVKSFLSNHPYLINARGPHGLSLLHHAKKGGDQAAETRLYLESLGAT
ncbi:MAG: hypothetical protein WBP29_13115, partial [Candidatus Zixiibacteriota bacterium]